MTKPKIPAALKRDLELCGSYRKLAVKRGVNIYWISQLFTHGVESTNPITRVKLSMPRKVRKPATKAAQDKYRQNLPPYLKWWRELSKEERRLIVFMEYLHKDTEFSYEKEKEKLCQ